MTRYGMRVLDGSGTELVARVDIAGAEATVALAYTGSVTLELWSLNDDGVSWQRHTRTFAYAPAPGATTSTITAPVWDRPETIIDGGEIT
jgi:hypothetical protein